MLHFSVSPKAEGLAPLPVGRVHFPVLATVYCSPKSTRAPSTVKCTALHSCEGEGSKNAQKSKLCFNPYLKSLKILVYLHKWYMHKYFEHPTFYFPKSPFKKIS